MKKKYYHLKYFFLYTLLAFLVFSPVVFLNRTFIPSEYYPLSPVDGNHRDIRVENVFDIDLATPAFYEEPINKTIGNVIRNNSVPLWNPYQGIGVPLASQYSTRAFNPYQLLENLSPYWMWDYFYLFRLIFAGFFTFLFLKELGLNSLSAVTGGIIYQFSGSFIWFINLEQFTNVAMYIPLLMFVIEKSITNKNILYNFFVSAVISLVLYAGQPEIALYVLVFGFTYTFFRLSQKNMLCLKEFSKILYIWILGFFLAFPIILIFLETMLSSFSLHPVGGNMGIISPAKISKLISLILPAVSAKLPFYKILPRNGSWDYLGGYISIVSWILILSYFISNIKKINKLFLFFTIFGFIILLKDFNVPPFSWIGYLPLFNQVWTPRWAGCVWVFSLSISSALAINDLNKISLRSISLAIFIFLALLIISILNKLWVFSLKPHDLIDYVPVTPDFIRYNLNSGTGKTISNGEWILNYLSYLKHYFIQGILQISGLFAILLVLFKIKCNSTYKQLSLLILILIELWFYIPKGCDYTTNYLYFIPLLTAWFGVLFLNRKTAMIFLFIAAVVSNILIDNHSKTGLPLKHDPFPSADFIKIINRSNTEYHRVMGLNGILFPNYAGAYKIYDVRYINALSVKEYNHFVNTYLNEQTVFIDPLWFTGITNNKTAFIQSLKKNFRLYSWLGVKYFLTPKNVKLDLPLIYSKDINIFENTRVFPRTYIVFKTKYVKNYKDAQKLLTNNNFDLENYAIIENKDYLINSIGIGTSKILKYSENKIEIETKTDKSGILVLTDSYFPGWRCWVDNTQTEILKINGLVRGISVPAGKHIVKFIYLPVSFISGIAVFFIGILCYAVFSVLILISSKKVNLSSD